MVIMLIKTPKFRIFFPHKKDDHRQMKIWDVNWKSQLFHFREYIFEVQCYSRYMTYVNCLLWFIVIRKLFKLDKYIGVFVINGIIIKSLKQTAFTYKFHSGESSANKHMIATSEKYQKIHRSCIERFHW